MNQLNAQDFPHQYVMRPEQRSTMHSSSVFDLNSIGHQQAQNMRPLLNANIGNMQQV